MMVLPRDVSSGSHTHIHKYGVCMQRRPAPPSWCQQQWKSRQVGARGSRLISTRHTSRDDATYAPHTSTSDHVVLSSRSLHPPPPLMWDTLESPENSPGERRRVDLGSSRPRGLPLIPIATRLLPQPPTVDFSHWLHHPSPRPHEPPSSGSTTGPFALFLLMFRAGGSGLSPNRGPPSSLGPLASGCWLGNLFTHRHTMLTNNICKETPTCIMFFCSLISVQ